jgi:hypothetical protein
MSPRSNPGPRSHISWSEFQEKEFETGANFELQMGSTVRRVWSSNQVNEAILGFDAVADPAAKHLIWRLLRLSKPPGVQLNPQHWGIDKAPEASGLGLPPRVCSLVIQYKRPEYIRANSRAAQRDFWPGEPFYRIATSGSQRSVLSRLQSTLQPDAHVTYCGPALQTYAALYQAMDEKSLLSHSTFVPPIAPDGVAHRFWTYQKADAPGKWNPDAFEQFGPSFNTFLSRDDLSGSALSTHLARMARGTVEANIMSTEPISAWIDEVNYAISGFRDFALQVGAPYQAGDRRLIHATEELLTGRFEALPNGEPFAMSVTLDVMLASTLTSSFSEQAVSWYLVETD